MVGKSVINAFVASLCLFSAASAGPLSRRQTLSIDDIQKQALANAQKVLDGSLSDGLTRSANCTKSNVAIRKELCVSSPHPLCIQTDTPPVAISAKMNEKSTSGQ
jgi:hypothetical protein